MRTQIVYEDEDILICRKPAGLATQSAVVSQPDVVSELKKYLSGAYLGIVHRLDQPVEGLLVFAKSQRSAAMLSRQLGAGTLNKEYQAYVYGQPQQESGELLDFLCKEGNVSRVVSETTPGAKKASLQYRMLKPAGDALHVTAVQSTQLAGKCNHLAIHIDTGRFHQIRCQLAHAGMPILGDRKYGTAESMELSRQLGITQTALCACRIQLRHPVTGRDMTYEICPSWIKE